MTMEPSRVNSLLMLLTTTSISLFCSVIGDQQNLPGKWELLTSNCGISAMHMQLLPDNNVIIFDWTRRGPSNISLPPYGHCYKGDCSAHSVEFNPVKNTVRPLYIVTNTWCSSGSLSPHGVLIQTGGTDHGENVTRYFKPFVGGDWIEEPHGLLVPRWYASNQILPNGKIIVVGGLNQFNYEFIPKSKSIYNKLHPLEFLNETLYYRSVQDNLYPFLHLSPDGNLFIFANDRAILLDYVKNRIVRTYPALPGRLSRNYPSTGSSVLLPLRLSSKSSSLIPDAEVLVCGGSWPNALNEVEKKEPIFVGATNTCGRLMITEENPHWVMEKMPIERIMGDMILLPTGDVLIVNGAKNGSAGFGYAKGPVLNPVLYHSDLNSSSSRFKVMSASNRPRMYHSTALLIPDGRVLVSGSNTHKTYNFTSLYPTDLSIEAFSPPYLTSKALPRPRINWIKHGKKLFYGRKFLVGVDFGGEDFNGRIDVTMVAPSFTTHSFSMNQRVLFLVLNGVKKKKKRNGGSVIHANAPPTAALAPPGYYLLFVIADGVPSRAIWVHIHKR